MKPLGADWRIQVVQPYSAQMNQLSEVATMLPASDHRTICKFRGDDDARYGEVWAALVEIISFEKPSMFTSRNPRVRDAEI